MIDSLSNEARFVAALSRDQLRDYLERPLLRDRLVITPLIDPPEVLGESSVDVRLGTEFLVLNRRSFSALDVAEREIIESRIHQYQTRMRINVHEGYVIHPGQIILGSTLEYIRLPVDLMCYVVGKSTWGRMGLVIATATHVAPGYKGVITLELVNGGEVPLVLYPGLPIAQLVFHTLESTNEIAPSEEYGGSYSCSTGPQFPHVLRDEWAYWFPRRP